MIKAKEKKIKNFTLQRHEPLKTFIMHSISLLWITLDILYLVNFITFWITILNGFFYSSNVIVKLKQLACMLVQIIKNEKNKYRYQGTIVKHCKRWLFYIITNLCCYNKLKIPCLGILLQKQNDIFFCTSSFFIYTVTSSCAVTMNVPFTFYDKYWT